MAQRNLTKLSDAALDREQQRASELARKARERGREIQAERDRRAAVVKVETMNDKERQQLAGVIGAEGIGSAEAFGTPGSR